MHCLMMLRFLLILSLSAISLAEIVEWTALQDMEYHKRPGKSSFTEAKDYCRSLNSNLAMPKTQDQLDFFNFQKGFELTWLGASKQAGCALNYCWLDGTPITNAKWAPLEPDGHDYVLVDGINNWNCLTNHEAAVICERPVNSSLIHARSYDFPTSLDVPANEEPNYVANEIPKCPPVKVDDSFVGLIISDLAEMSDKFSQEIGGVRSEISKLSQQLAQLVKQLNEKKPEQARAPTKSKKRRNKSSDESDESD